MKIFVLLYYFSPKEDNTTGEGSVPTSPEHFPELNIQEHSPEQEEEHTPVLHSSPSQPSNDRTPLFPAADSSATSHGSHEHGIQPRQAVESLPTALRKVIVYLGNNPESHSLTFFLAKYALIMAVYIFGGGSIVLLIFKVSIIKLTTITSRPTLRFHQPSFIIYMLCLILYHIF